MKKRIFALVVALMFTLALAGCGGSETGDEGIEAKASSGTYVGHDNDGVSEFLGISYAAPVEKWKAPTDPETTSGDVITCDEWGPSGIQIDDDVEVASSWVQYSDNLNLNVWTKDVKTTDKPVLVFIHGGGAWQGGTYDPCYDGEYFVRNLPEGEDAVMVTINYRMGIFGSTNFSGLEGYTDEYYDAVNLATLDQIQALKWINENIEAFGGDPDNVTVSGQSSGAGSASTLLAIDDATKYFNNAILESGTMYNRTISVSESKERAETLFDIMGVKTLDEFIALEDDDFKDVYDEIDEALHLDTNVPEPQRVADGKIVPEDCVAEIANGSADGINVMIGTTDGEYDWMAIDWDNSISEPLTEYDSILEPLEKGNSDSAALSTTWTPIDDQQVIDEYFAQDSDKVKRAVDLYNDTKYRQPAIYLAEALAKNDTDVYMYYWEWAPDKELVLETQGDSAEISPYGRAMHCMDQIIFFGTIDEGYNELSGPADKIPEDLVKTTQMTFYSFIKTGDPNNDLIDEWKTYDADTRETMIIQKDTSWKLQSDPRSEDRQILDKVNK